MRDVDMNTLDLLADRRGLVLCPHRSIGDIEVGW